MCPWERSHRTWTHAMGSLPRMSRERSHDFGHGCVTVPHTGCRSDCERAAAPRRGGRRLGATPARDIRSSLMPTIVVDVMPKAELLDPQGKAVSGAFSRLGVEDFTSVRIGKRFELTVDGRGRPTRSSPRRSASPTRSSPTPSSRTSSASRSWSDHRASGSSPSPVRSTTATRSARSASRALSRSRSGTARTISRASMRSSCPVASATATTSVPERSPRSRRSWRR